MVKAKSLDANINALSRLVEKGFAAVAHDIAQLPTHAEVRHIVNDAITKQVPSIIRDQTNDIRQEVASIRKDLEALTQNVDNVVGLPKEIDHALERIARIEKHLGLNNEIAA